MLAGIVSACAGCKRCVDCTVEHFEDLRIIAEVNDICGNEEDLSQEEANLAADYRCVQCVVFLGTGNHDTGILCGTRQYTDSIEQSNVQGANEIGVPVACEFFTDTLIITCHPAS